MNNLLIATDGSSAAEAAVLAGVQLAAEQHAKAVLIHVVEPIDIRVPSPRFGALEAKPHVLAQPENDDVLAKAASVAEEHGVPYELMLVSGFDVETILAAAEGVDAELIALGSNRHGAIATAFLGSVSQELLKRAKRPVLVVHPTPVPVEAVAH